MTKNQRVWFFRHSVCFDSRDAECGEDKEGTDRRWDRSAAE